MKYLLFFMNLFFLIFKCLIAFTLYFIQSNTKELQKPIMLQTNS